MSKHKSEGKDKRKSSQLVIRVDKAERDSFVKLCEQLETSAAREIRRFMREFVTAQSGENPIPDDEMKNAVIADAGGEEPGNEGAASQEPGAEAEVPASETETSKKKQMRVRL